MNWQKYRNLSNTIAKVIGWLICRFPFLFLHDKRYFHQTLTLEHIGLFHAILYD